MFDIKVVFISLVNVILIWKSNDLVVFEYKCVVKNEMGNEIVIVVY